MGWLRLVGSLKSLSHKHTPTHAHYSMWAVQIRVCEQCKHLCVCVCACVWNLLCSQTCALLSYYSGGVFASTITRPHFLTYTLVNNDVSFIPLPLWHFSRLLQLYVSFAKEPYKRDDILQKRPMILHSFIPLPHMHIFSFSHMHMLSLWHTPMCAMTHPYVCRDSCVCVPWLIYMYDMTHIVCVPWLTHTHSHTRTFSHTP